MGEMNGGVHLNQMKKKWEVGSFFGDGQCAFFLAHVGFKDGDCGSLDWGYGRGNWALDWISRARVSVMKMFDKMRDPATNLLESCNFAFNYIK